MINCTIEHGKAKMKLDGTLGELTAESMIFLRAVYEALADGDADGDAAERYKESIIENIEDAFKKEEDLANKAAAALIELLKKVMRSDDDDSDED